MTAAFTPPPLSSIEPESHQFTPPPVESLEPEGFTPPPVQSLELNDEEIIAKVENPTYMPTLEEYKQFQAAKERRPFSLNRVLTKAGQAAGTVGSDLFKLGKEVGKLEQWRHPLNTAQSVIEGAGRALYDQGLLARKVAGSKVGHALGMDRINEFLNEAQFLAAKAAQLNQEKFGTTGFTDARQLFTAANLPEELKKQFKEEYKAYRDKAEHEIFLRERAYQQPRIQATQGAQPLVPEKIGKVNQEMAEGMSYITDPTLLLPGGGAAKGAGLAEKAIGKVVEKGGKAVAKTAGGIADTGKALARKAEEAVVSATGTTPDKIRTVATTLGAGSLVTPAAPLTAKAAAAYVGLRGAEKAGQAAEAVGRSLPKANERFGLFANIAKDADAPAWLRNSAVRLSKLDSTVANAGAIAKGAAKGSAIGATIGGITEGEEGLASGLGAGGVLGATGAAAGRLMSRRARSAAAENADIDTWIKSKTPEEMQNIQSAGLTRQDALNMADVERMARGIVGKETPGDIEFKYLKDDEFRKRFGPAKGAQVVEGDKPTVYINTKHKGARSMLHETSHALEPLAELSPQRTALNKLLFDQVTSDGTVISKGLYSTVDMARFADQYTAKLSPEQKAEWNLLTADQKQKAIMAEVRAEHFANMIEGAPRGKLIDTASLRGRILDSLLTADSSSMLGKMRRGLEAIGVKFDASGAPSELFVKNGVPITNSAEVDAALRDYIRAKNNITKRLLASEDETPDFVISREEMEKGNKGAMQVLENSDIFARNPDGSIKTVGGNPEKIKSLEKKIGQLEQDARAAVQAMEETKRAMQDAETVAKKADEVRARVEEELRTTQNRVRQAELKTELLRARENRQSAKALQKQARIREQELRAKQNVVNVARKELAAEERLSGSTPVLLSDSDIVKLQTKRVEMMMDTLQKIPDSGEVGAVKLDPNVKDLAFAGKHFTDEQLSAIKALPDDVMSPSMKQKIDKLNTALKADDGTQIILDYNAALKGNKPSSGVKVSTRQAVPLSMNISKAGNFYMITLDTSHFYNKLQNWLKSKPKTFSPWNGDADLFIRDTFKYLDNHANGRPGKTGLAADDQTATLKRNIINDFFNVPGHSDVNPVQISTKSEKDNLIRSRRLDRINNITPSDGDKFPVDYGALKQNLLPEAE